MNRSFWNGKSVFITGHSGFKGGWLTLWLTQMGAHVHGYALPPPTSPSFHATTDLRSYLTGETVADIRDATTLFSAIQTARPDIVFHLAAQPLVRYSYTAPEETYAVNVMGTVNLLEAVRKVPSIKSVVNITTDKCYENREWVWPYRENEALGGYDPYSSSKACAELVTSAYRSSFFQDSATLLATARAGNVIGGGDWANDRLIPDFLRALDAGQPIAIRSPKATRPWQHVLDPLAGYLILAEKLYKSGREFAEAWNFGPVDMPPHTVGWIVEYLCSTIPNACWQTEPSQQVYEANTLKLDSSKALTKLGWQPRWGLKTALTRTLEWHSAWRKGESMAAFSLDQIAGYIASEPDRFIDCAT